MLVNVKGVWLNPTLVSMLWEYAARGSKPISTNVYLTSASQGTREIMASADEIAAIINAAELNLDQQVSDLIDKANAAVKEAQRASTEYRFKLADFQLERRRFEDKIALLEAELAGKTTLKE